MGFNIGSKIVRATGGSISRVGSHRIHQFPGEYVTDGLCLYVDTAHHDSMDIGAEAGHDAGTILDISGNGRHGTITNMPYNNITGTTSLKHNDHNGTTSYIEFTHAETPLPNLLTTELLVRIMNHPGSGAFDALWQKGTNWNAANSDCGLYLIYGSLRYHFGDHWQGNGTTYTETNLTIGKWYHIVTSSENLQGRNSRLYVNGVLVNANPCDGSAGRGPYTGPSTTGTLKINGLNGGGHNGEFGLFRTYNRQLSDEEVLQNFNSIKTRIHSNYSNYNVFTFTPTCSGNKGKVEVLAVGGGGSGGNDVGGGGAGGRALYNSSFTIDSGVGMGVTIGVGATSADTAVNGHGGNGGTTRFSTLTALGGNGGYGRSGGKSYGGWNGGGSSYNSSTGVTPDGAGGEKGYKGGNTGNPNQGNCGTGGGAGAGGVGGDGVGGSGGRGGHGGDGVAYSISGTSKYYAGGGGGTFYNVANVGGLSGSGVGGRGSSGSEGLPGNFGTPGVPRTGSGGGGGFSTGSYKSGGHGSEGCVIVRYPAEDYNIELLIVAGGGGGGAGHQSDAGGGGGGAGGLLYYSKVPVSSGKNYKVWVGEGGDKSTDTTKHASSGKNSFFGDKVAIGGGGGGSTRDSSAVPSGGSGGAAGSDVSPNTGGSGTTGQGHKGGNNATGHSGAGGGGASEAGEDAPSSNATSGAGGDGLAYSITGSSVTYAGGGGGGKYVEGTGSAGAGGAGGGGAGGKGDHGSAGTAGLGGGGGGGGKNGSTSKNGGHGGTGVVIVAYKGPQRGTGGTVSTTARPGYTTHTFVGYPKDGGSGSGMETSAHLFVA